MKSEISVKQIINTLLLVLAAFIWGSAFVAQSIGSDSVDAFTFLACRSWVGAIFLIPVTLIYSKFTNKSAKSEVNSPIDKKKRTKTLIIGGLCVGTILFFASYTQQVGVTFTTTAKSGFLTTMYVLIVPIVSLFLGKKVGIKIWFCVALGVIGLYLLCITNGFSLGFGDSFVLLSALLYSGHILVIDHFSPKVNGVALSCIQFFVTAILSTVCMFIFEQPSWEAIKSATIPILYTGLLSSGIGYTLQIIGQRDLNPTIASLAMSLESVFSALSGWLILQEKLSVKEFIGCALMFVAIIIAQLPDIKLFKKAEK